jgi:hypothetical protein
MEITADFDTIETSGADIADTIKSPLDMALEKQEKERYHQMILSQLKLLTECAIKASEIKEESLSGYEFAVKT